MLPHYDETFPSLKFISHSYPYLFARQLLGTFSPSSLQTNPTTMPDPLFGEPISVWKPIEPFEDDDEEFFFPDSTLDARQEHQVFSQPKSGSEQDSELMLDAEEKESESLLRICQVLMLSGIEYDACQSLEQPIAESQMTSSLPWSEIDENGIRWKEVKEGEDQGCLYFIKAGSIPLKLSAIPNEDGSTKLSYYTKNTIGKYCPHDEDPAEVEKFYKSLVDEVKPSRLTVFLNTKVFGDFTMYDLLEFHLLLDAFLIALYKNLQANGPPTHRTLAGFFILCGIAYSLYYTFVK
ncbi:hypothetical protein PS15p_205757 [Mucor circinelloides]